MFRAVIALLGFVSGQALARDDAAVPVAKLIANPKTYIGELVVVRGIPCVDPGGAGFLCEATVDNRKLRLDASVLGPSTAQPIAERLIGRCKGKAALDRSECRVDIVVTPTSVEGPDGGVTTIHAAEIEMYALRKIR